MRNFFIYFLLLGSLLHATDGREGGMTAIGLGVGYVSSSIDNIKTDSIGNYWDLKFGYGFNPNIVGFIEGSLQAVTKEVQQNSIGIGLSYYLRDGINSPYISAYIGAVEHPMDNYESSNGKFGNLWKIGAGYEYKQWFLQLNYTKASSPRVKTDSTFVSAGYNFHIFR